MLVDIHCWLSDMINIEDENQSNANDIALDGAPSSESAAGDVTVTAEVIYAFAPRAEVDAPRIYNRQKL